MSYLEWSLPPTLVCFVVFSGGCAGLITSDDGSLDGKLARIGLREVPEHLSGLPPTESRRWLAVEVIPGASSPLEADSAGYLIVGADRRPVTDRAEIIAALERWGPGRSLELSVRRNPYRGAPNESWDVELKVPW